MTIIRRLILALALMAGIAPAFAQAPPPVPALPDSERRVSYSISGTTCACSLTSALQLYGDGTDYQNWIEVYLNGVRVNYNDATFGWTITSPTGPIGNIARPITDGVLTFNSVQTGTVQIVGARRPRRTSTFSENQGVPARALNQVINDEIAMLREVWDKTNDFTGRALISQPGNTLSMLPLPSVCQNAYLGFDATGLNPVCTGSITGGGSLTMIVGTSPIQSGVSGRVFYQNGTVLGQLPVTGTGSLILSISPTLTTPILGVAAATSINGLSMTAGGALSRIIGIGTNLSSATSPAADNVVIGPANALTTGQQNVIIGTGGTGNAVTTDTSNTYIGYDVAPGAHNGSVNSNNTAVGALALLNCTTCGSNVVYGRGAAGGATTDDHIVSVGHASMFFGGGNSRVAAFGDSAGGGAIAGTAIPAGSPNVGTLVFGFQNDTMVECFGAETCGKTSATGRTNAGGFGSYSRVLAMDNSIWLGNGYTVGGSSAKWWDGSTTTTVNSNTGVTLTCAQVLAGVILRTGTAGAGFSDTTPTAQQIVQCTSGGPGNGSEVPISRKLTYANFGTTQTATMLAGSGITFAGPGAVTTTNNTSSSWRIIITNSTSPSEAVVFLRE